MDRREKDRLRTAEYRRKNPDKVREISARSRAKARQNPEKVETKRAQQAAWRQSNRASVKATELKKAFGINLHDYGHMLLSQNGLCAICARPETQMRGGKVKALAVDHDHATGKVRGLLCSDCNQALGKMKDDRMILLSAVRYLDGHTRSNVIPLVKESA